MLGREINSLVPPNTTLVIDISPAQGYYAYLEKLSSKGVTTTVSATDTVDMLVVTQLTCRDQKMAGLVVFNDS